MYTSSKPSRRLVLPVCVTRVFTIQVLDVSHLFDIGRRSILPCGGRFALPLRAKPAFFLVVRGVRNNVQITTCFVLFPQ